MCGRYANERKGLDFAGDFGEVGALLQAARGENKEWLQELPPTFSIAPGTDNPIVRERLTTEGELVRDIEPARWGLQPAWATPKQQGSGATDRRPARPAPINARLESVATNGMFRKAFAQRRAIVPMTGYVEWTQAGKRKQPWYVHSGDPLYAAGLYEVRKDDAGAWLVTYAIITTTARDAAGEVHDRMPVFLTPDLFNQWLQPTPFGEDDAEGFVELLAGTEERLARAMRTYALDPRINNAAAVDPLDPSLLDEAEPLPAG